MSVDWWAYENLLDRMWDDRLAWSHARTRDELVTLVDAADSLGDHGIRALCDELANDFADEAQLVGRARLAALSRPAAEHGFGPEWAAFHVSETENGTLVYATDRFGEPGEWTEIGVAEGAQEAEGTEEADAAWAAGETRYEEALGRWVQWDAGSGEIEYFHDEDQVWERAWGEGWMRQPPGSAEWLPFDRPSGTFLAGDEWLPPERLGAEPERLEDVELPREQKLNEVIAGIRAEGVGAEVLSDDEIAAMLDAEVLQILGGDSRG